ncbi:MAG TPA: ABC transporter permease [Thermoanaerobaculia bacterium]|nr:ABC transporter permease [Thermoanaerobaculia bacterium]
MAIPLKYNTGNLAARRASMLLTILGIGVINAVMLSMLALWHGVKATTVASGSPTDLIVMRESAETELSSWVSREACEIIRTIPGISKGTNGQPLVSPELVILFKLPRRDSGQGSNVLVRGITAAGLEMRAVKMIEGRTFKPGTSEVLVARRIHDRFASTNVGDTFHFGTTDYHVVGVFDAAGTAFDSEIWVDENFLASARKRNAYSTVLVRPADAAASKQIVDAVKNDNRLKLQIKTERKYYEEQTSGLFGIIILVGFVTFFMVIGAILGTMNTMFSAIASRTRELGTMRALGFKRRAILMSIVIESALVSLLGGVAGVLLALPINGISTGTTNFRTFSEIAFNFRVDASVALTGIVIALVAGVAGGLLPAVSAARMPITKALREI